MPRKIKSITELERLRGKLEEAETKLRSRLKTWKKSLLPGNLNLQQEEQIENEIEVLFKLYYAGQQDELIILGSTVANSPGRDGNPSTWKVFVDAWDLLKMAEVAALQLMRRT